MEKEASGSETRNVPCGIAMGLVSLCFSKPNGVPQIWRERDSLLGNEELVEVMLPPANWNTNYVYAFAFAFAITNSVFIHQILYINFVFWHLKEILFPSR